MDKIQHIIFVDDDNISSFINRAVLEEMQVAENLSCLQDGQEALDYIQEQCNRSLEKGACQELIFLDLNMPLVNGFDFLEQLQRLPEVDVHKLYIVMLTSSLHSRDMDKARQYPIKDYLTKPLTIEKVEAVVEKYQKHLQHLS